MTFQEMTSWNVNRNVRSIFGNRLVAKSLLNLFKKAPKLRLKYYKTYLKFFYYEYTYPNRVICFALKSCRKKPSSEIKWVHF